MSRYLNIPGFSRKSRYADMSDEEKFEYNLIFGGIYMAAVGILLTLFYLSGLWSWCKANLVM